MGSGGSKRKPQIITMEEHDRYKLQTDRIFIMENIANLDDLMDHLFASEVLTESLKQKVKVKLYLKENTTTH